MCPAEDKVSRHTVAVVGGGVAGLVALKVLRDRGVDAHVYEREAVIGGVWNRTYKNVRLQQHKDDFKLPGTEWPEHTVDFPDAKAVEAYIAKFASEHKLTDAVTRDAELESCVFDETTTRWRLTFADRSVCIAQHIIVATGALGKPKKTDAASTFESFHGEVMHSSEYYDAANFHGKDVLVVGGGSSAVEIAVDLARAADSCVMSCRSDPDWVFPRHGAFGESLRLCGSGGASPLWLRNLVARCTFRLKYGDLGKFKMKPTGAPLNRRIVVSDEFYPLVSHGAIDVRRGGIDSVKGDVVTFVDGSNKRFDAVILCTGYSVATHSDSHPYLAAHLPAGAKLDFYLGCFLPDVRNCAFIGGCFGFAAVPRISELQAKAVANVITGATTLPSPETQRRDIARVLKFHVQRGNTCVYTANAYYRRLMEAAGELNSAALVDASVKLKGAGALAAVGAAVVRILHGKNDDRSGGIAIVAAGAAVLGGLANAVGRMKQKGAKDKKRRPARVDVTYTGDRAIEPSDSVTSMTKRSSGDESPKSPTGVLSERNSRDATDAAVTAPKFDPTMSEKSAELTNSRFKTPKALVQSEYDKWADTYEHDSLNKIGFASPKVCVDTLLKFCPPEGKKVLDVGAGTGLLGQMMTQRGHKAQVLDAMDLSPKMLQQLVKKGIYQEVKAHNMTTYPWPFESDKYDGLMCNGVLIYVDDPNCLEEFVRVTKPGGVCVIMFRHDGYPDYEAKDMALRAAGKWELIHKSPDMRNFDTVEYDSDQDVWFNQWVFRVLETSA